MKKASFETLQKSYRKQFKGTPFYRLPKTNRCRPTQQLMLLSVDRPVYRPTVKFLTVAACRSTARSTVPRL